MVLIGLQNMYMPINRLSLTVPQFASVESKRNLSIDTRIYDYQLGERSLSNVGLSRIVEVQEDPLPTTAWIFDTQTLINVVSNIGVAEPTLVSAGPCTYFTTTHCHEFFQDA